MQQSLMEGRAQANLPFGSPEPILSATVFHETVMDT
jgi:hypothetical protein